MDFLLHSSKCLLYVFRKTTMIRIITTNENCRQQLNPISFGQMDDENRLILKYFRLTWGVALTIGFLVEGRGLDDITIPCQPHFQIWFFLLKCIRRVYMLVTGDNEYLIWNPLASPPTNRIWIGMRWIRSYSYSVDFITRLLSTQPINADKHMKLEKIK